MAFFLVFMIQENVAKFGQNCIALEVFSAGTAMIADIQKVFQTLTFYLCEAFF